MSFIGPHLAVGIHTLFLVTGVLANLFILIVNFQDWLKTHDSNPATLIINSIALINLFFQGAVAFNEVASFMFVEFYIQVWVVNPLVIIMSSLAFSSLWCSTCLCFYYFIKIINFSSSFFHKLKAKIPAVVPWLLIISVAVSWSVGVPAYWDLYMDIKPMPALTAHNATLLFSATLKSKCKCLFEMYMLFAALAFSIIFITAGSIITSLCKHMIRMKKSNEGSGNSRIHSHLSAAKTVTSLLLLYLIFFGFLSSLFSEVENARSLIFFLSFIVVSSFPTFNSIILIMGNRKLSNSMKNLLCMRLTAANTEVTITTY
ncbi:taste receptor type 2 member 9-like [Bufo gargarizans]|uniref:taste receptor type 2 member 9-like n=1 Tax=Bufo gargarizans TaxID=30331 RepID=UPI001CF492E2|nr:taste receptor type 2 member 9-like [Bufo gargarizans]